MHYGGAAWSWVPGHRDRQCTTRQHLSAQVSKDPCLSVCSLAPRLISQSVSCHSVCLAGGGCGHQTATVVLLPGGRLIIPVMWRFRMGSGVPSFCAFMCSRVVTGHLFTARLWVPGEAVPSRKHVTCPSHPCGACRPCPSPGLQPSTASLGETDRSGARHLGAALSSATFFPGDFGQETVLSMLASVKRG